MTNRKQMTITIMALVICSALLGLAVAWIGSDSVTPAPAPAATATATATPAIETFHQAGYQCVRVNREPWQCNKEVR